MAKKSKQRKRRLASLRRSAPPSPPAAAPPLSQRDDVAVATVRKVWPLQSECMSYYGDPRTRGWYERNVVEVPCPWLLRVGDVTTDHIHVHRRCAESLMRVLGKTWIDCGRDVSKVRELHFDIFDGSYNLRAMRGSSALSVHSWAAAIDFDAAHNPFRSREHFFKRDTPLIANFLAEGWIWGGDWSLPDAMHVQAARIR